MKKIIASICLFVGLIAVCSQGIELMAAEGNTYIVGKSINLVTSSVSDSAINDNNYIFDMSTLYNNRGVVTNNINNNIEKKHSYSAAKYVFTVNCSDLDKYLWIMFDASGTGSDEWRILDLDIKLEYVL